MSFVRAVGGVLGQQGGGGAAFDLLDIAWAHAYWVDGPEFTALGLSDTNVVNTWPDEAGTSDAAWRSAGTQPTYTTTGMAGAKGIAAPDASTQWFNATITSISQPVTFVVIAQWFNAGAQQIVNDGTNAVLTTSTETGRISFGSALNTTATAPTDGSPVLLVATANGASSFYDINGTRATGNAGTNALGTSIAIGDNGAASPIRGVVNFIGILDGTLTAGELANIEAFATSNYGITIA